MKKKKIIIKERKVSEDKDAGMLLKRGKRKFRKPQLILNKKVHITEDVYILLRKQKRKQKKSMALITCELIKNTYGQDNE
jgi:hypothetical protein